MKPEIVFIDDDSNLLDGLRRRLFRYAHQWDMAFYSDVDAAIEHLNNKSVDALVCDIKMPGTSGLELLDKISGSPKNQDLPIVMMSGVDDDSLKCQSLDRGAIDLIAKPINFEELVSRINSMTRTRIVRTAPPHQVEPIEACPAIDADDLDYLACMYRVAKQYDSDTGEHIARVGWYSREIAVAMGMDNRLVENLFWAAPLHDIGKVGVPSEILRKQEALTPGERTVLRNHCAIGELILRGRSTDVVNIHKAENATDLLRFGENPILSLAASIALTHHERWDGSGYPLELSGEKIPIESHIVAVADVFDAINSQRCYHEARDPYRVCEWIVGQRELLFHPEVIDAFHRALNDIMVIREALGQGHAEHTAAIDWE